jgi:3-mercaptopyruvate sulfurtransferase SseA
MVMFFAITGRNMGTDAKWQDRAKGLLKGQLKERGVTYKQLAEKLREMGVEETEQNIANKISRGGFSAVFLLQVLDAIGCKEVRVRLD